ncbi:hypothetical protein [Limnochorda pilosa]|nr:hypothetical protein [Limnochorda pilosa]
MQVRLCCAAMPGISIGLTQAVERGKQEGGPEHAHRRLHVGRPPTAGFDDVSKPGLNQVCPFVPQLLEGCGNEGLRQELPEKEPRQPFASAELGKQSPAQGREQFLKTLLVR